MTSHLPPPEPQIPEVLLLGVGDCGPIHEPLDAYASLVRDTIATGDIRFAQCEKVYSERGYMQVHSQGHYSRQHPRMASVFADCEFNVVSVAGNHSMDWGAEALLDTIGLFRDQGVQTIGGGENIAEARKPAIFDIHGTKIGMLGYCAVLREGYAAGTRTPGVAPIRAHTYFEVTEYFPGAPPRVVTVPFEEDLEALRMDIAATLEVVDVVVVSIHWGIHTIPKVVSDYERIVAREVFAAGASLILGHHPHIPKGIEVFDGKVCFYSLSHFMFSSDSEPLYGHRNGPRYGVEMDPEYPHLPFGKDGQRTLVARAVISRNGADRVSFLPARIDRELRPEILHHGDQRFAEEVEYMNWASSDFPHTFTVEGDEVVISP